MLAFAYLCVVLIWATTPLAIQWSSQGVSYSAAAAWRMTLAVVVALVIHAILRRRFIIFFQHWKIFLAASLGVFPNMPLIYWSAQFIPSGIVAVIFSLSPLAAGLMSWWLLNDNPFTLKRVFALLTATTGLSFIFYEQWQLDLQSLLGVTGVALSSFLFCFSSVLVKKLSVNKTCDAFSQATGSLLFALPGLWCFWWWQDGQLPDVWPPWMTINSIIYLSVIGSLMGAGMFFYVLQHLSPGLVSLITLITPVLALGLGNWLADESLTSFELGGIALVLSGLVIYTDWAYGRAYGIFRRFGKEAK